MYAFLIRSLLEVMCFPIQAIWIVNMANVLFWFIIRPTDTGDTVRTIVTRYVNKYRLISLIPRASSMAAVLTTSMTLRIILSVRGNLDYGGSFKSSVNEPKSTALYESPAIEEPRLGVKVTVNRDIDYDTSAHAI